MYTRPYRTGMIYNYESKLVYKVINVRSQNSQQFFFFFFCNTSQYYVTIYKYWILTCNMFKREIEVHKHWEWETASIKHGVRWTEARSTTPDPELVDSLKEFVFERSDPCREVCTRFHENQFQKQFKMCTWDPLGTWGLKHRLFPLHTPQSKNGLKSMFSTALYSM